MLLRENVPCLKSSSLWFEPARTARATFLPSLFRFNYAYLICLYPALRCDTPAELNASAPAIIHLSIRRRIIGGIIGWLFRFAVVDRQLQIFISGLINAPGNANNLAVFITAPECTRLARSFIISPLVPVDSELPFRVIFRGKREREGSPRECPWNKSTSENSRYTQFYSRHLAQIALVSVVH